MENNRIDPAVSTEAKIPDILFRMQLELIINYREALGAENMIAMVKDHTVPPNHSLYYDLLALKLKDMIKKYCDLHGILPEIPELDQVLKEAREISKLREELAEVTRRGAK